MADNTNLTQSANRVSFGRGELAKCDLSKTGMIFFATDTQEIIIPTGATTEGVAKYTSFGLSITDAAKIDASFNNATYSVKDDNTAVVITFTRHEGDDVTVEIPLADKSQPGLMTEGQVAMLESAHAGAEFLLGDENTTREITIGEGESATTVTLKSVLAAEKDAKDYAKGLVDALDLDEVSVAGQAIVKISQANGKVAAEAGNISADYVNVVADHEVTSIPEGGTEEVTNVVNGATSVQEAFNYVNEKIKDLQVVADGVQNVVNAAIDALDTEESGEGKFVTVTVTQADGLITAVKVDESDIASAEALKSLSDKVGGEFTAENTVAAAIEAVSDSVYTLETGKVADNTAAIAKEVEDREKAVEDAVAGLKGNLGEGEAATLEGIHDRIDLVEEAAGAISYKIKKTEGTADSPIKATYTLLDKNDNPAGDAIEIYKDSSIISITLVDQAPVGENDAIVEGQYLEYKYIDVNGKEEVEYVDVSAFLTQAEFGNGLDVSSAGVVSVKVDSSSEYLTVGSNGVKVSGIDSAIETATSGLETKLVGDAATYKTFGSVEDHFEVIDKKVEDLEAADANLTEAIAAAEKAAKDHADSKVKELADGAVKTNTDAVAAIKTSVGLGDDYSFAATDTNYVSDSTSVKDAIVALDNAVKANEDSLYWYEG